MKPNNQLPPTSAPTPGWEHSLSTGAPGISLLYIERARTGTGDWGTVHAWATAMTRNSVIAHPDISSLYQGAPAVAFALHSAGHPAYATAQNTLDGHVAALTQQLLKTAHERIDRGQLPSQREFDLIGGLTGLGAYILHRHGAGDGLLGVLAYLVRLTEPLKVDGAVLPGWWSGDGPDGVPSSQWPGGHANFGVAHGIAGPLALLATALRRGITVPGQSDAIETICSWLDQWRRDTGPRAWWPETISLAEWQDRTALQTGPLRPSWCYGTPGLARAQQLAALALGDPVRQQRAEDALAGCLADERQLSQLRDASLCHGWAGLIHTTWRAAGDAGSDSALAASLPHLRACMEEQLRHEPPDGDGLLEGVAGVYLARHTAAVNTAPSPRWDACLLLDG